MAEITQNICLKHQQVCLKHMIIFCGNCAETEIFTKTWSDGLNHEKKNTYTYTWL